MTTNTNPQNSDNPETHGPEYAWTVAYSKNTAAYRAWFSLAAVFAVGLCIPFFCGFENFTLITDKEIIWGNAGRIIIFVTIMTYAIRICAKVGISTLNFALQEREKEATATFYFDLRHLPKDLQPTESQRDFAFSYLFGNKINTGIFKNDWLKLPMDVASEVLSKKLKSK